MLRSSGTVWQLREATNIHEFVEGQFKFHAGLARACHNPVISLLIDGLARVIRTVMLNRMRMLSMVSGSLDRNVDAHAAVVQSLREHEPEMARISLQECYALWRREASKISILDLTE